MNAWIRPSLMPLLVVELGPEQPFLALASATRIACGSAGRAWPAAPACRDVDLQRREEVVEQLARTARAPMAARTRSGASPRGSRRTSGSRWGRATSRRSNCAMFGTTNRSAPGPDRGTATSYCPSTRCARKPSTVPTCAPMSSGESCASMPAHRPASPRDVRAGASRWLAHRVADPRGGRLEQPARLSVFALTHSARRTARDLATSVGRLEPGEPRDVQLGDAHGLLERRGDPRRSASRSSPASCALATPTWRASSQFTGPDEDDITRCISRNSGASAKRLGIHAEREPESAASLVAIMHDAIVDSALVTMAACPTCDRLRVRRRALTRCRTRRSRSTRRWRASPTPARAATCVFVGHRAGPLRRGRGDRPHVRGVGRARRRSGWREIADELPSAWAIRRVAILHRTGDARGRRGQRRRSPSRRPTAPRRSRPAVRASSASRRTCPSGRRRALVSGEAHWVMGS